MQPEIPQATVYHQERDRIEPGSFWEKFLTKPSAPSQQQTAAKYDGVAVRQAQQQYNSSSTPAGYEISRNVTIGGASCFSRFSTVQRVPKPAVVQSSTQPTPPVSKSISSLFNNNPPVSISTNPKIVSLKHLNSQNTSQQPPPQQPPQQQQQQEPIPIKVILPQYKPVPDTRYASTHAPQISTPMIATTTQINAKTQQPQSIPTIAEQTQKNNTIQEYHNPTVSSYKITESLYQYTSNMDDTNRVNHNQQQPQQQQPSQNFYDYLYHYSTSSMHSSQWDNAATNCHVLNMASTQQIETTSQVINPINDDTLEPIQKQQKNKTNSKNIIPAFTRNMYSSLRTLHGLTYFKQFTYSTRQSILQNIILPLKFPHLHQRIGLAHQTSVVILQHGETSQPGVILDKLCNDLHIYTQSISLYSILNNNHSTAQASKTSTLHPLSLAIQACVDNGPAVLILDDIDLLTSLLSKPHINTPQNLYNGDQTGGNSTGDLPQQSDDRVVGLLNLLSFEIQKIYKMNEFKNTLYRQFMAYQNRLITQTQQQSPPQQQSQQQQYTMAYQDQKSQIHANKTMTAAATTTTTACTHTSTFVPPQLPAPKSSKYALSGQPTVSTTTNNNNNTTNPSQNQQVYSKVPIGNQPVPDRRDGGSQNVNPVVYSGNYGRNTAGLSDFWSKFRGTGNNTTGGNNNNNTSNQSTTSSNKSESNASYNTPLTTRFGVIPQTTNTINNNQKINVASFGTNNNNNNNNTQHYTSTASTATPVSPMITMNDDDDISLPTNNFATKMSNQVENNNNKPNLTLDSRPTPQIHASTIAQSQAQRAKQAAVHSRYELYSKRFGNSSLATTSSSTTASNQQNNAMDDNNGEYINQSPAVFTQFRGNVLGTKETNPTNSNNNNTNSLTTTTKSSLSTNLQITPLQRSLSQSTATPQAMPMLYTLDTNQPITINMQQQQQQFKHLRPHHHLPQINTLPIPKPLVIVIPTTAGHIAKPDNNDNTILDYLLSLQTQHKSNSNTQHHDGDDDDTTMSDINMKDAKHINNEKNNIIIHKNNLHRNTTSTTTTPTIPINSLLLPKNLTVLYPKARVVTIATPNIDTIYTILQQKLPQLLLHPTFYQKPSITSPTTTSNNNRNNTGLLPNIKLDLKPDLLIDLSFELLGFDVLSIDYMLQEAGRIAIHRVLSHYYLNEDYLESDSEGDNAMHPHHHHQNNNNALFVNYLSHNIDQKGQNLSLLGLLEDFYTFIDTKMANQRNNTMTNLSGFGSVGITNSKSNKNNVIVSWLTDLINNNTNSDDFNHIQLDKSTNKQHDYLIQHKIPSILYDLLVKKEDIYESIDVAKKIFKLTTPIIPHQQQLKLQQYRYAISRQSMRNDSNSSSGSGTTTCDNNNNNNTHNNITNNNNQIHITTSTTQQCIELKQDMDDNNNVPTEQPKDNVDNNNNNKKKKNSLEDEDEDNDDEEEGGQDDFTNFLPGLIGHKHAKSLIYQTLFLPLRYPEIFNTFQVSINTGILLYGPEGCGKSLIARALSTLSSTPRVYEANNNVIDNNKISSNNNNNVNNNNINDNEFANTFNFISTTCSDILSSYFGESEAKLTSLFQKAQSQSPAILYFDQIDSLGKKRSGGGGNDDNTATGSTDDNAMNRFVSQFLMLFDNLHYKKYDNNINAISHHNQNNQQEQQQQKNRITNKQSNSSSSNNNNNNNIVLVIGSTNLPSVMDPALLRSGRFEHHIYLGLPDYNTRLEFIMFLLNLKKDYFNNSNSQNGIVGDDNDNINKQHVYISNTIKLGHLEQLAIYTRGCSYADVENIISNVKQHAIRRTIALLTTKTNLNNNNNNRKVKNNNNNMMVMVNSVGNADSTISRIDINDLDLIFQQFTNNQQQSQYNYQQQQQQQHRVNPCSSIQLPMLIDLMKYRYNSSNNNNNICIQNAIKDKNTIIQPGIVTGNYRVDDGDETQDETELSLLIQNNLFYSPYHMLKQAQYIIHYYQQQNEIFKLTRKEEQKENDSRNNDDGVDDDDDSSTLPYNIPEIQSILTTKMQYYHKKALPLLIPTKIHKTSLNQQKEITKVDLSMSDKGGNGIVVDNDNDDELNDEEDHTIDNISYVHIPQLTPNLFDKWLSSKNKIPSPTSTTTTTTNNNQINNNTNNNNYYLNYLNNNKLPSLDDMATDTNVATTELKQRELINTLIQKFTPKETKQSSHKTQSNSNSQKQTNYHPLATLLYFPQYKELFQ